MIEPACIFITKCMPIAGTGVHNGFGFIGSYARILRQLRLRKLLPFFCSIVRSSRMFLFKEAVLP